MQTGFIDLGSKKVYYNEDGTMHYGEKNIDGSWYYFKPGTGAMATGWTEHHGHRYYYDDTEGKMYHGIERIERVRYDFDESTGVLKTEWRIEDGKINYGNV